MHASCHPPRHHRPPPSAPHGADPRVVRTDTPQHVDARAAALHTLTHPTVPAGYTVLLPHHRNGMCGPSPGPSSHLPLEPQSTAATALRAGHDVATQQRDGSGAHPSKPAGVAFLAGLDAGYSCGFSSESAGEWDGARGVPRGAPHRAELHAPPPTASAHTARRAHETLRVPPRATADRPARRDKPDCTAHGTAGDGWRWVQQQQHLVQPAFAALPDGGTCEYTDAHHTSAVPPTTYPEPSSHCARPVSIPHHHHGPALREVCVVDAACDALGVDDVQGGRTSVFDRGARCGVDELAHNAKSQNGSLWTSLPPASVSVPQHTATTQPGRVLEQEYVMIRPQLLQMLMQQRCTADSTDHVAPSSWSLGPTPELMLPRQPEHHPFSTSPPSLVGSATSTTVPVSWTRGVDGARVATEGTPYHTTLAPCDHTNCGPAHSSHPWPTLEQPARRAVSGTEQLTPHRARYTDSTYGVIFDATTGVHTSSDGTDLAQLAALQLCAMTNTTSSGSQPRRPARGASAYTPSQHTHPSTTAASSLSVHLTRSSGRLGGSGSTSGAAPTQRSSSHSHTVRRGTGAERAPSFPAPRPNRPSVRVLNSTDVHTDTPSQTALLAAQASNAPKAVNGTRYTVGVWYEGVVKRYNPLRGFGFVTGKFVLRYDPALCERVCLAHAPAAPTEAESGHDDDDDAAAVVQRTHHRDTLVTTSHEHDDVPRGPETEWRGVPPAQPSHTTSASPCAHPAASNSHTSDSTSSHVPDTAEKTDGVVVLSTMQWFLAWVDRSAHDDNGDSTTTTLQRIPIDLGDIFVHHSCISLSGFRVLPVNTAVRFSVAVLMNTVQAVDVVPLGPQWPLPVPRSPSSQLSSTSSHSTSSQMAKLAQSQHIPPAYVLPEPVARVWQSGTRRVAVVPSAAVPNALKALSTMQLVQLNSPIARDVDDTLTVTDPMSRRVGDAKPCTTSPSASLPRRASAGTPRQTPLHGKACTTTTTIVRGMSVVPRVTSSPNTTETTAATKGLHGAQGGTTTTTVRGGLSSTRHANTTSAEGARDVIGRGGPDESHSSDTRPEPDTTAMESVASPEAAAVVTVLHDSHVAPLLSPRPGHRLHDVDPVSHPRGTTSAPTIITTPHPRRPDSSTPGAERVGTDAMWNDRVEPVSAHAEARPNSSPTSNSSETNSHAAAAAAAAAPTVSEDEKATMTSLSQRSATTRSADTALGSNPGSSPDWTAVFDQKIANERVKDVLFHKQALKSFPQYHAERTTAPTLAPTTASRRPVPTTVAVPHPTCTTNHAVVVGDAGAAPVPTPRATPPHPTTTRKRQGDAATPCRPARRSASAAAVTRTSAAAAAAMASLCVVYVHRLPPSLASQVPPGVSCIALPWSTVQALGLRSSCDTKDEPAVSVVVAPTVQHVDATCEPVATAAEPDNAAHGAPEVLTFFAGAHPVPSWLHGETASSTHTGSHEPRMHFAGNGSVGGGSEPTGAAPQPTTLR